LCLLKPYPLLSELLEGEAERVVGFSEQVSGYFAQKRETALADKRAQLAGLTSQGTHCVLVI